MIDSRYEDLRDTYVSARKVADGCREHWLGFLPILPAGLDTPAFTGNIVRAYEDLTAAEAREVSARDALFAVVRRSER